MPPILPEFGEILTNDGLRLKGVATNGAVVPSPRANPSANKTEILFIVKSDMLVTVNVKEVLESTDVVVYKLPFKYNFMPSMFPAGNPVPIAVICKEFVAGLKAWLKDVIVTRGVANVKLQFFPGHSASDEAAKITSTRLSEEVAVASRPVYLILHVS